MKKHKLGNDDTKEIWKKGIVVPSKEAISRLEFCYNGGLKLEAR